MSFDIRQIYDLRKGGTLTAKTGSALIELAQANCYGAKGKLTFK